MKAQKLSLLRLRERNSIEMDCLQLTSMGHGFGVGCINVPSVAGDAVNHEMSGEGKL
jgi:hypothetical protein